MDYGRRGHLCGSCGKNNEKTLLELAVKPLPAEFMGYGIDVVAAGFEQQLEYLGVDVSFWAAPKPGNYREPANIGLPRVVGSVFSCKP